MLQRDTVARAEPPLKMERERQVFILPGPPQGKQAHRQHAKQSGGAGRQMSRQLFCNIHLKEALVPRGFHLNIPEAGFESA